MATIAIMIGGAILSATAFTGSRYLAKYISGDSCSKITAEKYRHDLAQEKYTADWQSYQKKKDQFSNWLYNRKQEKNQAENKFVDTDEALQYYNETHPDEDRI